MINIRFSENLLDILNICLPGISSGRSVINPWSLLNATRLPKRVIAPIIPEAVAAIAS